MSPQQQAGIEAARFVAKVNEVILFPLIALLVGVAFLVFLYGCAEYIFNAGNETARQKGKSHILWGIIGFVVMLSAYALLRIAAATFGLNQTLDCATNPSAGNCTEVFRVR